MSSVAFNIHAMSATASSTPTTTTKTECCTSCNPIKMENEQLKAQMEVLTQVNWQLTIKNFALEQWKSAMEFQMPAFLAALNPATPTHHSQGSAPQTPSPSVVKSEDVKMVPVVAKPKEAPVAPMIDMIAPQSPGKAMKTPKFLKTKEVTTCFNCGGARTTAWRRSQSTGMLLCNPCGLYEKLHKIPRPIGMKTDNILRRHGRRSGQVGPNFAANPKNKTAVAPPPVTFNANSLDEIIEAVVKNSAAPPAATVAADDSEIKKRERIAAILAKLQTFRTEN